MTLRIFLVLAFFNMLFNRGLAASLAVSQSQISFSRAQNSVDIHLPPSIIPINENPTGVLDATAWALIYTYALGTFSNWIATPLQNASVNEIVHQRTLATSEPSGILKPNVDTVYSRVVLDLSTQDVVLTIPEINDRYYVFPVYDPFGNAIAEIGSTFQNKSGKYLIRRAEDAWAAPGYETADQILQSLGYQGIVNMPTSYGTMLIRLLVVQNTTEELDTIRRYQDQSNLEALPRSNEVNAQNPTPALIETALNGSFLGISSPSQLLEFAARLLPYNQPELNVERYRVASILAQAGVYNGQYRRPEGINLTEASAIANASYNYDVSQPYAMLDQGNNWTLQTNEYQGNYGRHYSGAAYVALGGYQQQTTAQALYPTIKGKGWSVSFDLEENQSVLFTFSAKPKLKQDGFWSLTVYGENNYLVPNSINRFEAGDRTYNLTYQDTGELVYGPNSDGARDGPFQVLLQPADVAPPLNWTSNWLPVARKFSIILRFYVLQDVMLNGTYEYPKVENIAAIV